MCLFYYWCRTKQFFTVKQTKNQQTNKITDSIFKNSFSRKESWKGNHLIMRVLLYSGRHDNLTFSERVITVITLMQLKYNRIIERGKCGVNNSSGTINVWMNCNHWRQHDLSTQSCLIWGEIKEGRWANDSPKYYTSAPFVNLVCSPWKTWFYFVLNMLHLIFEDR